jgi:hypothetical protein
MSRGEGGASCSPAASGCSRAPSTRHGSCRISATCCRTVLSEVLGRVVRRLAGDPGVRRSLLAAVAVLGGRGNRLRTAARRTDAVVVRRHRAAMARLRCEDRARDRLRAPLLLAAGAVGLPGCRCRTVAPRRRLVAAQGIRRLVGAAPRLLVGFPGLQDHAPRSFGTTTAGRLRAVVPALGRDDPQRRIRPGVALVLRSRRCDAIRSRCPSHRPGRPRRQRLLAPQHARAASSIRGIAAMGCHRLAPVPGLAGGHPIR